MSISLGAEPDTLTVHLSVGADFNSTLVLLDDAGAEVDWPVGTVITLRFARTTVVEETWTATITGAEATFDKDKAVVDATIAANRRNVRLFYVNGAEDLLWASGTVAVHA